VNDQRLRVGVVGLGFAGRTALEAFSELPDVEVVALAGLEKDILTSLGEKHGVPHLYEKWEDLLETEGLEAVSIGTPTQLHAPIALKALEKGLHVLSEKPLARTVAEGTAMVEASKAAGRVLKVVFNHRERGDVLALKHQIDEGQLGRIYYAKAHWMRRNGIPGMGGWFTNRELSGGGPLIDLGVHIIDLCWWLMGMPQAVSVSGATFAPLGARDNIQHLSRYRALSETTVNNVEDYATAQIRFGNGAVLDVDTSYSLHARNSTSVKIHGDKGGAEIEPELLMITERHDTLVHIQPQIDSLGFDFTVGFANQIDHFLQICRGEISADATAEHGLEMARMLSAIYESARSGSEVKITH
jgi:predicted dehydrogenase